MGLKVIITSHSTFFNCFSGMNSRWHPEISESSHVIYPTGKPMAPHLLRCQGLAVNYYSCALDAPGRLALLGWRASVDLQHPRLLQRSGKGYRSIGYEIEDDQF